jgi:putative serine protease PepD
VTPGGPAASAGLQAGDVITGIDGVLAGSADQLDTLSVTKRPGDTVRLTYRRGTTAADAVVTLGALQTPVP